MTSKYSNENIIRVVLLLLEHITDVWHLNDDKKSQLFVLINCDEYPITTQSLTRVSLILEIYKNLHLIFPNPNQANNWVNRVNTEFGGLSALDFIMEDIDKNLAIVNAYLNEQ